VVSENGETPSGRRLIVLNQGIKANLSVPIVLRNELIGILRLYDGKPREFSYREVEFITALAEQGGIAIQNAHYFEQVEKDHKKEMAE
jgi:GAF domain-containing protein